jgi:DNA-binding response OmpR family regulator
MKILLVHKEDSVLSQVKSIIQDNQTVIKQCTSGLDGLMAIRNEEFDLIISGIDLPVLTGFELIRSLRTHSVNDTTPVVFIVDERGSKSEYLANALCVEGMLTRSAIEQELTSWINVAMHGWKSPARQYTIQN